MDLAYVALIPIAVSLFVLLIGVGLATWRSRRGRGRGLTGRKRTATE